MPYKEFTATKLYHSISEVAKMFDVNTSLIRYWENEFDIIKPKKNKKGNRMFSQTDIDNLHIIYHLVKDRGYTLQGAKDKLKEGDANLNDNMEIVRRLKSIKNFLLKLKEEI